MCLDLHQVRFSRIYQFFDNNDISSLMRSKSSMKNFALLVFLLILEVGSTGVKAKIL